ncbi:MAG: glycosyltransferase family 39 protein, partial [Bacteroidales bacterium]|nr:glycosyltransferase family 39 protein [Bacteroidales bacterium]
MDNNGDNYYYFMLAQNLAEGLGYVTDIGLEPVPHTHFPPGYPAFMSLFMHIFPDNAVAMKVLNGLLLLLSLLLLYHILVRTAPKYGRIIALASCLLCTLHPDLLRWSTIIMSEMLYLTVSLAIIAVFLALDWESLARKRTGQILLVALLCAFVFCTYYIRTIGISVVLALMAALAVVSVTRKKWLPLVVCGLVALSLFAAHESWSIRNSRAVPGYKSDYLNTFKQDGSGKDMATLEQWSS